MNFLFFILTIILSMQVSAIEIHGHRGARAVYPENSVVGFEYASHFADYLEMDLHLTKDNQLVVTHDAQIADRCVAMAGAPLERTIYFLNYSEIQKFDCGSKRDKDDFPKNLIPGIQIPLFSQVVAIAKAKKIPMTIELKYADTEEELELYPTREVLVDKFLRILVQEHIVDQVIIQSFDEDILKLLRKKEISLNKSFRILFLYKGANSWPFPKPDYAVALEKIKEIKPDYFSPNFQQITSIFFYNSYKRYIESNIDSLNFKVVPFTVNGKKDWKAILKFKIFGIFTDDPEGLREYLEEESSSPLLIILSTYNQKDLAHS